MYESIKKGNGKISHIILPFKVYVLVLKYYFCTDVARNYRLVAEEYAVLFL